MFPFLVFNSSSSTPENSSRSRGSFPEGTNEAGADVGDAVAEVGVVEVRSLM